MRLCVRLGFNASRIKRRLCRLRFDVLFVLVYLSLSVVRWFFLDLSVFPMFPPAVKESGDGRRSRDISSLGNFMALSACHRWSRM